MDTNTDLSGSGKSDMNTIEKINTELVRVYQEMSELTRPECGKCRIPLSCCDPMYCDLAEDWAKARWSTTLEKGDHPRLHYMSSGGCTVPPHMRPICTLHTCAINSCATSGNPLWDKKYFRLRAKIAALEDRKWLLMGCPD